MFLANQKNVYESLEALTTVYYHKNELGLAKENHMKAIKYFEYYCKVKNIKKSESVHERLRFKQKQLIREINRPTKQPDSGESTLPLENLNDNQVNLHSSNKADEDISDKLSKMYIQNHEFSPKNSSRQMNENMIDQIDRLALNEEEKSAKEENDFGYQSSERISSDNFRNLTEKELNDRYDETKTNITILDKKNATASDLSRSNHAMTSSSAEEGTFKDTKSDEIGKYDNDDTPTKSDNETIQDYSRSNSEENNDESALKATLQGAIKKRM
jgi:hypothetical protein